MRSASKIAGLVLLLTATTSVQVRADAPLPPPQRSTVCSPSNQFCVTSDPQRGTTFAHPADKADEPLWSIPRWFRVLYLSDDPDVLVTGYDGRNLVPLDEPGDVEVLAFWRRGRLVRAYKLSELLPDLGKLRRTASHYHWGNYLGFDSESNFRISTVDGHTLVYDPVEAVLLQRLRTAG